MKQTMNGAFRELRDSLRELRDVTLATLKEFPPLMAYLMVFCLGGTFGIFATLLVLDLAKR